MLNSNLFNRHFSVAPFLLVATYLVPALLWIPPSGNGRKFSSVSTPLAYFVKSSRAARRGVSSPVLKLELSGCDFGITH